MRIEQNYWTEGSGWKDKSWGKLGAAAQVVFVFGSPDVLKREPLFNEIKILFPKALIWGCSTAGEIIGTNVFDHSLVVTAVHFEHGAIQGECARISQKDDSSKVGESLAKQLDPKGLKHVLVLSDGLLVNGSALVQGLLSVLPSDVAVTGGLSGDGARFKETLVVWNAIPQKNSVAVVGLYGERIKIGYGSLGGWDSFGPEREITRSQGNVLYELDGKSALDLYKKYLGEHAQGLPSTGLLFPLCVRSKNADSLVVRTILGINEEDQSLTFAGDMPMGSYARLMKANFDRLIDGAVSAAKTSSQSIGKDQADLAILISCVGRKLILKQRIEEEVEGVQDVLGKRAALTGFYSYGEISPFTPGAKCELHNQTMTITTFSES